MSTVLTDAIHSALRSPCVARCRATPLRIADRAAKPHSVALLEPEAQTPFTFVGGADRVRALVESFYDIMSDREPDLSRLHRCTPDGRVDRYSRDRFALFLIGWLGGPQDTSPSTATRGCACAMRACQSISRCAMPGCAA